MPPLGLWMLCLKLQNKSDPIDFSARKQLLLALTHFIFLPLVVCLICVCPKSLFAQGTRAEFDTQFQKWLHSDRRPVWFPVKSCSAAWGGQNLFRFQEQDFLIQPDSIYGVLGNFGYSQFLQRVKLESNVVRQDCYKDWSILVYMAADNDLSPFAIWDLLEMEGGYSAQIAGSQLRTDLIVEVDADSRLVNSQGVRRYHIFQRTNETGEEYFEKMQKMKKLGLSAFKEQKGFDEVWSPVVEVLNESTEESKSQAQRFANFLNWGMKAYPASNYMVIVWGHGEGWLPGSGGEVYQPSSLVGKIGGLAFDDSGNGEAHLSTPDLKAVFSDIKENILNQPGEGEERRISVYASDACLMQSAEVAYEIAPFTDYIVGSAQVQSYLGYPYRTIFSSHNQNTTLDGLHEVCATSDLACQMAYRFVAKTKSSFTGWSGYNLVHEEAVKNYTVSAFSSRQMQQSLISDWNSLGKVFLKLVEAANDYQKGLIIQSIQATTDFDGSSSLRQWLEQVSLALRLIEEASIEMESSSRIKPFMIDRTFERIKRLQTSLLMTEVSSSVGENYSKDFDGSEDLHDKGGLLSSVTKPTLFLGGISVWLPRSKRDFNYRYDLFAESDWHQSSLKETSLGTTPIWIQVFHTLY